MCQSVQRMSQSPASTEYCTFQPSYYATSITTGYWVTRIDKKCTGDVDNNFFEVFHVVKSLNFGFFNHDFFFVLPWLVFRVILILTVIIFVFGRRHSWFEAKRLLKECINWEDKINLCAFLDLLFMPIQINPYILTINLLARLLMVLLFILSEIDQLLIADY